MKHFFKEKSTFKGPVFVKNQKKDYKALKMTAGNPDFGA